VVCCAVAVGLGHEQIDHARIVALAVEAHLGDVSGSAAHQAECVPLIEGVFKDLSQAFSGRLDEPAGFAVIDDVRRAAAVAKNDGEPARQRFNGGDTEAFRPGRQDKEVG